ncbi:hypothetical protein EJ06DRAFT_553153 [Trichodelitschia bisporula]|uniref:Uncharacterized protein n=1 Tax=Trichodelitschia bisporula TaxID=703511 RepID=A0A6G1I8C3_9PEZI|nr:hypothetical protein EJ06DRAFT_553153 [Trichodelitschia bisporula]
MEVTDASKLNTGGKPNASGPAKDLNLHDKMEVSLGACRVVVVTNGVACACTRGLCFPRVNNSTRVSIMKHVCINCHHMMEWHDLYSGEYTSHASMEQGQQGQ